MDFTRPERCRQQRTGQEDRRSKFYETPDNLREDDAEAGRLVYMWADDYKRVGPDVAAIAASYPELVMVLSGPTSSAGSRNASATSAAPKSRPPT